MMAPAQNFSRRAWIARGSCFGAFCGIAKMIRLPELAERVASDSRVSQAPIVDKGYASVRKVGDGLYATISDPSKGYTTISNGGFLVGKDAALLIEGFALPAGAFLQMDALRMVSQVTHPSGAKCAVSVSAFDRLYADAFIRGASPSDRTQNGVRDRVVST